jgi:uncharacterized protein YcbK (DUF882 family)
MIGSVGARKKDHWTLILLGRPGSRARELKISRAWPAWAVLATIMMSFTSLCVGRQARAWVGEGFQEQVVAMPQRIDAMSRVKGNELWRAPFAGRGLLPVGPSALAPSLARALEPLPRLEEAHVLRLFDVNAKASLTVQPFHADGSADPAAFSQIDHFMRCRRSGEQLAMNQNLIKLLGRIASRFGGAVLHVISAHRRVDGAVTKSTSQHAFGTAADIRIPGVSLTTLQRSAYELGAKGIGIYPVSRFVHVDTRSRARYWRDEGEGPIAVRSIFD